MRQTIMLMAACAAVLAGCTNEVGEGLGIDTPIQVTASVEGALTTRTDNSTESLSTFGLSIKDKDDSYTSNYGGENILAEKDNGTWTLGTTVLYQGNGQSYYAYAPYVKGHTGESLTFTVDANQATNDLQGSDLLYAAGNVDDPTLAITLAHKLSKLTVTLTPEGLGTDEVSFTGVTLRGTLPTTTLALVDGESVEAGALGEATDDATDIKMWESSTNTYECILVPQAATYSVLIYATVGGEQKTYVYTPSAAYKFESDRSYTLALKVKKADEPTAIKGIAVKGWDESIALGDGEAEESYTIDAEGHYTVYTAEGLQAWADAVGESSLRNPVNCTLAADIDMTGQNWTPIMTGYAPQYNGVFDGNGHTITGLGDCLLEENEGEVRNLTLVNPTGLPLPGSIFSAGAVAGINEGTIENCHVVGGSVKGDTCSGGIVGINGGIIRACSSSAMVTTDGYNDTRGGGIVGANSGTILACYATGSVNAGDGMEGAIAGENANNYGGIMTACYWSGESAQGVGYGSEEGVEEVAGDVSWADAAEAMNTALNGTGYLWKTNGGDEMENRPLIIATE